ncbi:MAG: site-2 protease family protein [Roseiflexaceae bacterium]|nr:site-2 protease family protein [Roseiflexaceae bacterium]
MNAVIESTERLELVGQMRVALGGLMNVESYAWDERGALTMRGQLDRPADSVYRDLRARVETLGYTPFLRSSGGQDELFAMPGVIPRFTPRTLLPFVLFLITIATVLLTGAFHASSQLIADPALLLREPALLLGGVPFAATLLGILFTHEMGHYVVGRLRKAPVSLPYFIPIPPIPTPIGVLTLTGTLGAVIVQREPMEDRRSILEIGIAGPIAGLLVAIPLLFYGVATSPIATPSAQMIAQGYMQEGNSILYGLVKYVAHGQWLPGVNNLDVQMNSVAFAAWIGLLVTMLNMLPVGQLDGGHVAYALLGRRADWLAYAILALCVVLGVTVSVNWLIWGALIMLIGPRHPAPLNDITPLGFWHKVLAVFGLLLFVLLFTPEPLRMVAP